MNKIELLQLIANGENSGLEFKRDDIDNRVLAKELVAFANLLGGIVLLGVEDDGSISGIARPNLEEWVMTACRDKIRPEIIPFFEVVRDVEPGKDVAIVSVGRGWGVHIVWHNAHRTYYIRVGTQSREASPEELERLFQQRGGFRLELRPVSGSSLPDLDRRRLKDYFARTRSQDVPQDADEEGWRTLLVNTEIMLQEGGRALRRWAGCSCSGIFPTGSFPRPAWTPWPIRAATRTMPPRSVSPCAPMVSLFQIDLGGKVAIAESGLVEQAIEFVRRNTEVTSRLQGGVRVDRWTYPEPAVRETIVNALVHRDYLLSGTTIELSIYADRLEVISPGRLPNGITPARMKTGCRAARNQLLKDVMRDYNYLEHTGLGVPRKIVKGMMEYNGTQPDLIEEEERFIVRLWK